MLNDCFDDFKECFASLNDNEKNVISILICCLLVQITEIFKKECN